MVAASRDRNIDLVRTLLRAGADVRAEDGQRGTALLAAATNGDVDMMRLLIERGADVNVATRTQGLTPLGMAISSNRVDAVTLLLAHGADVAVPGMNDAVAVRNGRLALRNQMALTLAPPYGSPALMRTLLKAGADVNAADERHLTPLMLAVASETQDVKVVELLLETGARVNEPSATGETALDWANKFNSAPVLALLKNAGARVGIRSITPNVEPAAALDVRKALHTSIALLQRSSTEFSKKGGCVGCHHQPMAAMAVGAARRIGAPVDEDAAHEQARIISAQAAISQARLLQGNDTASSIDLGLALGLRESNYPADVITDSFVMRIARTQRSDGSWLAGPALSRAPMSEGDISPTVEAVRTLQTYGFPAAKPAFDERIARARRWLLRQQPRTAADYALLLLGLSWTAADQQRTRRIAAGLIARQRADGGWAGNANLASDAFATGQALYALRETGLVTADSQTHRRGAEYLLKTQYPDGAWHVRSRAPKIQPYFQSGFPFDHDQWISAAATAWAATALAAEVERVQTGTSRTGSR